MNDRDLQLNRLLRSAAQAPEGETPVAPFGFDTRVVALWRSNGGSGSLSNGNGIGRLVQRVAILAAAIILVSSAAIVREFNQTRELGEPMTNDFAIADSAIQDEMSQQ